jgi:hypothetical protein
VVSESASFSSSTEGNLVLDDVDILLSRLFKFRKNV